MERSKFIVICNSFPISKLLIKLVTITNCSKIFEQFVDRFEIAFRNYVLTPKRTSPPRYIDARNLRYLLVINFRKF